MAMNSLAPETKPRSIPMDVRPIAVRFHELSHARCRLQHVKNVRAVSYIEHSDGDALLGWWSGFWIETSADISIGRIPASILVSLWRLLTERRPAGRTRTRGGEPGFGALEAKDVATVSSEWVLDGLRDCQHPIRAGLRSLTS